MNRVRRAQITSVIAKLTGLREQIEWLSQEEMDAYDNLPESIQETERGESMQEAAYAMERAGELVDQAIEQLDEANR